MVRRVLFAVAAVSVVGLRSSSAVASASYPSLIVDEVQKLTGKTIAEAPPCTLCHTSLSGGNGTVVTYVGLSMQDFGLQGGKPSQLVEVVDESYGMSWDSDGDGV